MKTLHYTVSPYTGNLRRVLDVRKIPGPRRFDEVVCFSRPIRKMAARLIKVRTRQLELF